MILFYDLETSGLLEGKFPLHHPKQPRIVQLGAILDDDDRNEVMRLDVIIAQKEEINPKAVAVHKITTEYSQLFGVNELHALDLFLDMLDVSDMVVGQNHINFDNKVMTANVRRVYEEHNLEPFEGKRFFDTMEASKPILRLPSARGGFKNPNLTEIHQHFFGEGFGNAHRAIADVLACRKCFYALQDLVNPKGI